MFRTGPDIVLDAKVPAALLSGSGLSLPDLKPVLARLARGASLSEDEAEAAFDVVMSGAATPAQIGALMMGMRVRGESIAELTGAVRALRRRMLTINAPAGAIDVCGTGGDQHGTLNVSTAVAFVLAGLGLPVAKHGNRGQSSPTGGTDVLLALGVPPLSDLAGLEAQIARHHVAFLAAPTHHPAMRHAGAIRAELGTRTLFNLLGPLCNPAGVCLQLVGVFDEAWLQPVAETLRRLGSQRVWAVHGTDADHPGGQGLDELTLAGPNHVVALENGALHRFELTAAMIGLPEAPIKAIAGGSAAHNATALEALLQGAPGAYRDTVLFNAAAALCVARGNNMFPPGPDAPGLRVAMADAARAIDTGSAWQVLAALRADGLAAADGMDSMDKENRA